MVKSDSAKSFPEKYQLFYCCRQKCPKQNITLKIINLDKNLHLVESELIISNGKQTYFKQILKISFICLAFALAINSVKQV